MRLGPEALPPLNGSTAPSEEPARSNGPGLRQTGARNIERASQIMVDAAAAMEMFHDIVHEYKVMDLERYRIMRADAELAVERERIRADERIAADREYYRSMREEAKQVRADIERRHQLEQERADRTFDATESTREELQEQIDELMARVERNPSAVPQSALDKVLPLLQQAAPEVLPHLIQYVMAKLDGQGAPGRLASDGRGGNA